MQRVRKGSSFESSVFRLGFLDGKEGLIAQESSRTRLLTPERLATRPPWLRPCDPPASLELAIAGRWRAGAACRKSIQGAEYEG